MARSRNDRESKIKTFLMNMQNHAVIQPLLTQGARRKGFNGTNC